MSVLIAAGLVLAGCGTTRTGGSDVQSIHVFAVPVAVNLDRNPGPDGFSIRVYARGAKSSKGVRLHGGTLEVLMFDGLVSAMETPPVEPLRTWRFTGTELKQHLGRSAVGEGYRFTLGWEHARQTQGRISLVTRYHPPSGAAIASAPASVSTSAK